MEKEELIQYWIETAAHDRPTVQHLYDSGDYAWCLFVGHLVIEKLLKACYVKRHGVQAPKIHALVRLAKLAELNVDSETNKSLDTLTLFNIRARYPDRKRDMRAKATREYAAQLLRELERIRKWLLKTLSE